MKKVFIVFILLFTMLFSSCKIGNSNNSIQKTGLDKADIERITITNNRYAGRYTIIGKKNINRFIKSIIKAKDVKEDTKLEPDFIMDFYDNTKKVASYKYVAGIHEKNLGNLIDEKGNLYHINPSIENEFIKRLMKKDNNKNVTAYYISLIEKVLEKMDVNKNAVIIIDFKRDYSITRSITSVEQKRILSDIENEKSINFKLPGEAENYDYYIKINTNTYDDKQCVTVVSITDKNQTNIRYKLKGTFERGKWSYFIDFI